MTDRTAEEEAQRRGLDRVAGHELEAVLTWDFLERARKGSLIEKDRLERRGLEGSDAWLAQAAALQSISGAREALRGGNFARVMYYLTIIAGSGLVHLASVGAAAVEATGEDRATTVAKRAGSGQRRARDLASATRRHNAAEEAAAAARHAEWQAAALEIWAKPGKGRLSASAVATYLAERFSEKPDTIRRNIRKP